MGFTDNYSNTVIKQTQHSRKSSASSTTSKDLRRNPSDVSSITFAFPLNFWDVDDESSDKRSLLIPDQEILDSTEEIYFKNDVDTGIYELNVSKSDDFISQYANNNYESFI